jgi:DNA-binding Lrp family transcriptional regulator
MRSDSSALAVLDRLPATPVVTAQSIQDAIGVSFNAANNALETLAAAGILTKTSAGRRNRAFEARELVDAFTDLERQLASSEGDTKVSEPSRKVPPTPARRPRPR